MSLIDSELPKDADKARLALSLLVTMTVDPHEAGDRLKPGTGSNRWGRPVRRLKAGMVRLIYELVRGKPKVVALGLRNEVYGKGYIDAPGPRSRKTRLAGKVGSQAPR